MGKKTKKGATRLDKYYKLAKEQGYRSRASFKLIQLNRRHEFLNTSHCALDLCAAPGGWSQVAVGAMPVGSTIIAVDLVRIRPVPHVDCIIGDITTQATAAKIRGMLIEKMNNVRCVDCVLHDGSPNVGQAWLQDAFSQVALSLSALKLATLFMTKGAVFVTKVFRSRDHGALVATMQKLFRSVIVTKPRASRESSAEIYVVCKGYLAPTKLDKRLIDPNFVFADGTLEDEEEQSTTMVKKIDAIEFIRSDKRVREIAEAFHQISFSSKTSKRIFEDSTLASDEIKLICQDLQVIGTREVRLLSKWKSGLKSHFAGEDDGSQDEEGDKGQEEGEVEDVDEALSREIVEARKQKEGDEKRRKKKQKKEEMKRLGKRAHVGGVEAAKEIVPGDSFFTSKDLERLKSSTALPAVRHGDIVVEDKNNADATDENENDFVERMADEFEDVYEAKMASKGKRIESEDDVEAEGEVGATLAEDDLKEDDSSSSSSESEDDVHEDAKNKEASRWFDQDIFKMSSRAKRQRKMEDDDDIEDTEPKEIRKRPKLVLSIDNEAEIGTMDSDRDEALDEEPEKEKEDDSFAKLRSDPEKLAEVRAIARQIYERGKDAVVDESFHRNSFNNEKGLPNWFFDDEKRLSRIRRKAELPKEEIEEEMSIYPHLYHSIAESTIKRVVEARARKKKRALRRLKKVKDEMESIIENPDVNPAEKRKAMEKIQKAVRNKGREPYKEKTYVVAKKGGGSVTVGKKKGGKVKRVDRRMKKDVRAAEARERRSGKKSRGKKRGRRR